MPRIKPKEEDPGETEEVPQTKPAKMGAEKTNEPASRDAGEQDSSDDSKDSETTATASKPKTTVSVSASASAETVKLHQQASSNTIMSEFIQCGSISTPMTKLSCYVEHTITNHPAVLFTGVLTTVFCCYLFCRKTLKRNRRWNRHGRRHRGGGDAAPDGDMGEYAALAVYDELLDDFDREDLSSAYTSGKDDDDDSIGTIISQWSESENGNGNGNGSKVGGHRGGSGKGGIRKKIELTAFDDGHLSLSEVNG